MLGSGQSLEWLRESAQDTVFYQIKYLTVSQQLTMVNGKNEFTCVSSRWRSFRTSRVQSV